MALAPLGEPENIDCWPVGSPMGVQVPECERFKRTNVTHMMQFYREKKTASQIWFSLAPVHQTNIQMQNIEYSYYCIII